MFDPLAAILAAMLAYFMFGENLYIGRYIICIINESIQLINKSDDSLSSSIVH